MEQIQVLVRREWEDCSVVVSADKTDLVRNAKQLLISIRKATAGWFLTGTKEANRSWEYAGEDYNIGDLASDLGNESLLDFLRLHGVVNLQIESCPGELQGWEYDTPVVTVVSPSPF